MHTFERRTHAGTKKEQEKYWRHLSHLYMTEESDDPSDENKIVIYKLPWRSEGWLLVVCVLSSFVLCLFVLNKFIKTLHERVVSRL